MGGDTPPPWEVMITASHNPVRNNGVKVATPGGSMMTQRLEPFADAVAGAPAAEDLVQYTWRSIFVKKEDIPFGGLLSAEVLLGRERRPSGEALLEAAKQVKRATIRQTFLWANSCQCRFYQILMPTMTKVSLLLLQAWRRQPSTSKEPEKLLLPLLPRELEDPTLLGSVMACATSASSRITAIVLDVDN
ncbi:hypothetical protein Taro_039490 [Colocasia esculenta]|uniref:Alpha-D-phosphohexomutase alpha/beta/alpha domain-containing protein n=1 Tax=Colocasia esculenta TaxID=4460 RepID=A0A843WMD3_COLES|nr:hypothetical protein [Colocasia esculenta]